MTTTKQFEAGKSYSVRSICDSECVFTFEVVSRTAKMLTLKSGGKTFKRGVYVATWEPGVEKCKPMGTYSMCPVISADKVAS